MIEHESQFELYHYHESLCSQMVRGALEEKQLDWTSHPILLSEVSRSGDNLTPEYLRVNPKGQVPTLVHDGEPVYDSWEIIRYLDRLRPESGSYRTAPISSAKSAPGPTRPGFAMTCRSVRASGPRFPSCRRRSSAPASGGSRSGT